VIAEVGVHDATRKLNVRAGKYFIRERGETHLLEGTLAVAAGDDHLIADGDLARVEYVRVAAKGASLVAEAPRHDAIEAGFLVRTALVAGGDPCAGAIAGYAIDLGWISVTPRVSACRERTHNAFLSTATDDITADARIATTGIAPARTIGAGCFGGGGSIAVALGHGASASLAAEVDTFVLRRDDSMATRWDSTLSFGAVLGIGVTR
jgi:hypothetical protein